MGGENILRWGEKEGGLRPPEFTFLGFDLFILSGRFLQTLPEADKDHAEEHGDGVKYQHWNHLSKSFESFRVRGDRHDNVYTSTDAGEKQDATQYIVKDLHLSSCALCDGFH